MRESSAKRRVANSLVILVVQVALVARAPSFRARNRLAIGAIDPGWDVQGQGRSLVHAGTGKVPESALATPLRTVVAESVLGEDTVGCDSGVVADHSWERWMGQLSVQTEQLGTRTSVAGTSLAVATVAVTASSSPSTDTLYDRCECEAQISAVWTTYKFVVADTNTGRLARVQPGSPSHIAVGESIGGGASSSPYS